MINDLLILLISVVPSIALLLYTKSKGNYTTKPSSLLAKMFVYGAILFVPIYIFEVVFDESLYSICTTYEGYIFASCFFCAGMIEEAVKLVMLMHLSDKFNKYLKTAYDCIIFSVCVSLGFAVIEDLIYAFIYYYEDGLSTALVRAVTPGHFCFSIIMGLVFSKAMTYKNSNYPSYEKWIALSLVIPMVIHGLYDYVLSIESSLSLPLFAVLSISLNVLAYRQIKRISGKILFF